MMEEWSYTLLIEAEYDRNLKAPAPQAACTRAKGAGRDRYKGEVPAAVSPLLL